MLKNYLFTILLFLAPHPAVAETPPAIVSQNDYETNLLKLADFFFPSDGVAVFVKDACRTAYMTKLSTTAADMEMEKVLPGIHERMVSAAGDYCDAEIVKIIRQEKNKIVADWRGTVTEKDLKNFVDVFASETKAANDMRVEVKEGDTATAAVSRIEGVSASDEKIFKQKQAQFGKTQSGREMLNRVSAYQVKMSEIVGDSKWLAPMMKQALANARAAANSYAIENGFSEPYPR